MCVLHVLPFSKNVSVISRKRLGLPLYAVLQCLLCEVTMTCMGYRCRIHAYGACILTSLHHSYTLLSVLVVRGLITIHPSIFNIQWR